jgi:hypothetical protein
MGGQQQSFTLSVFYNNAFTTMNPYYIHGI